MNIVFIPHIKLDDGRSTPYHYSIKSWENWAKQYKNIKVIEWTEPIMDPKKFKITLQRYWVHDILEFLWQIPLLVTKLYTPPIPFLSPGNQF